ncbi:hypothetical protein ES705_50041 [subsurface metagenome]
MYYLNFHIDWAFEVNFNDLPHFFGQEDLRWELGTYPTIDFAQNPMDDSEILSLNWEECIVPSAPILTITTPSPTNSPDISLEWTTSVCTDNYTLYRHTAPITSSNLISTTKIKTIMGTSTSDTVSGLGRWYYAITANNESGSSDPSNSPYIDVVGPSNMFFAWNRTWGTTDGDYGREVAVDSEGNIYIVGFTNSYGAGGNDILLIKYNSLGTQIW